MTNFSNFKIPFLVFFVLFFSVNYAFCAKEQSIFEMIENQQNNQNQNNQVNYSIPLNFDAREILGTDEPDPSQDELYQYSNLGELDLKLQTSTQSVYMYEPFYIDVSASIADATGLNPSLFIKSTGVVLINKKIQFNELKPGQYTTKLWLAFNEPNAKIDEIAVVMKRGGELVKRNGQAPKIPEITPLEPKDDFCNVVADELIIKNIKSSKFDEAHNLILIKLEARNGNLSEFSLSKNYQKQSIENLRGDVNAMNADYFVIANQNQTSINFSYFNAISKSYKSFNLPIKISGENISTQTNLNPKTSELATYKNIAIYTIIIICLLSFVLWRSFYGLILGVIFIAYALYDARPFNEIIAKPNTEISILPMDNSRIFHTIKTEQSLKILGTYKNYTKVLLDNGKIGWIKNQSIK